MADQKPYTIRWGILATGGIATTFVKDLLVEPATRDVTDIAHTVVAAASSTSASRAEAFLRDTGVLSATSSSDDDAPATPYGSFAALLADPRVDIVYVATPHSHHFQNALACLRAGKHVLCEKAFTTNAAQTRILVDEARERKLFLMEAVWTRFFPLARELRAFVADGGIGEVRRVFADFSFSKDVEGEFGTENRMVNPALAGGVLLDLGVYSITWVFQFLYHLQPAGARAAPTIVSSMTPYPPTGADEMTSMVLTFPPTGAHGIATTNLRVSNDPDGATTAGAPIRIQGTLGEIQVYGSAPRPTRYRVIPSTHRVAGSAAPEVRDVEVPIPGGGHGMFWEADESARCVRDGRLESEGMGWEESVVIMEAMDEVRRQNGLRYPERIESTEFPLEGF